MPRKLDHIWLYRPDRSNLVTDTDLLEIAESCTTSHRLMEDGKCQLVIAEELVASIDPLVKTGQWLRLVFDDATFEEYEIKSIGREYSGDAPYTIVCDAAWMKLGYSIVKNTLASTGKRRLSFSLIRMTPAEALAQIMSSALGMFAAGNVDGLDEVQKTTEVNLYIDAESHLSAIRLLCSEVKSGCEFNVRQEAGTYYVDLVKKIGSDGDRIIASHQVMDEPFSGFVNRLNLRKNVDASEYFSRLYATMGSEESRVSVADAEWIVDSAGSGGSVSLTLKGNPIPFDGFAVGYYFGNRDDGVFQVTGSTAPGTITLSGAGASEITKGYFCEKSNGERLPFLPVLRELEEAFGVSERVVAMDGAPFENVLAEQGLSDDFSSYSGGMPPGWTKAGDPIVFLSTDEQRISVGTGSMGVTANKGEGVVSSPIEVTSEYFSVWISAMVDDGEIVLEVVDDEDNVFPDGKERAVSNNKNLAGFGIGGIQDFVGPVRVRITATRDNTRFFVDAITVTESAGFHEWAPHMGARGLWRKAAEFLVKDGGSSTEEYAGQVFELSELPMSDFDEIVLGGLIQVADGPDPDNNGQFDVNIETRVVALQKDWINERMQPLVTLDRNRTDLIDRLTTERERDRPRVPGAPRPERRNPLLNIKREDKTPDESSVTLTLTPLSARAEMLKNYTIFGDQGDGEFEPIASDVLEIDPDEAYIGMWGYLGSVENTGSHQFVFNYPIWYEQPLKLRFYVVENATDLKSEVIEITVMPLAPPNNPVDVAWEPSQTGATGQLTVKVRDPGLVATTIEYAIKAGNGAYGSWQDSPFALSNGTIGTDHEWDRRIDVELVAKHNTEVKFRVGYMGIDELGYPVTKYYEAAHTFDLDIIPEASFLLRIGEYDDVADRYAVLMDWHGDEDTKSIRYRTSTSPFIGVVDVPTMLSFAGQINGRVGFSQQIFTSLAHEQTLYVQAVAFSELGGTGIPQINGWFNGSIKAPSRIAAGQIGDGAIPGNKLLDYTPRYGSTIVWTSVDNDTVSWTSGVLTLSDGTSYSINSGSADFANTLLRYFYWDKSNPTTVQVTTSMTTATGVNKILLALGRKGYDSQAYAMIIPGVGLLTLNAENLTPNSVTTNMLRANIISGVHINAGTIQTIHLEAGSVTLEKLAFTPLADGNIVALINASTEGITINANRTEITSRYATGAAVAKTSATYSGSRTSIGFTNLYTTLKPGDRCFVRNLDTGVEYPFTVSAETTVTAPPLSSGSISINSANIVAPTGSGIFVESYHVYASLLVDRESISLKVGYDEVEEANEGDSVFAVEAFDWTGGVTWYNNLTVDVKFKIYSGDIFKVVQAKKVGAHPVYHYIKVTSDVDAGNGVNVPFQRCTAEGVYVSNNITLYYNSSAILFKAAPRRYGSELSIYLNSIVVDTDIFKSGNYSAGSDGWALYGNGDAEVNSITARGQVELDYFNGSKGGSSELLNELRFKSITGSEFVSIYHRFPGTGMDFVIDNIATSGNESQFFIQNFSTINILSNLGMTFFAESGAYNITTRAGAININAGEGFDTIWQPNSSQDINLRGIVKATKPILSQSQHVPRVFAGSAVPGDITDSTVNDYYRRTGTDEVYIKTANPSTWLKIGPNSVGSGFTYTTGQLSGNPSETGRVDGDWAYDDDTSTLFFKREGTFVTLFEAGRTSYRSSPIETNYAMLFRGSFSGDPSSGRTGEAYYNTSTSKIRIHNGSGWIEV